MRFLPVFSRLVLAAVLSVSLALAARPVGPVASGQGFSFDCDPILGKAAPGEKFGPRYLFKSDPSIPGKRLLAERGRLKLLSYNVLNLTESPGKYVTVDGKQVFQYGTLLKPPEQIAGVIRNIKSEMPDMIVGIEIESLDAMEKFDRAGLGDLYYRILVPGNDERGINIGIFVRRDLAIDIEVQSHREMVHVYLGKEVKVFSRDFPVVSFRNPGAPEDSEPVLILAGVHLKSQRSETEDLLAIGKRTAQVEVMTDVIDVYEKKYGGRVPIFMAGDFNADVTKGAEFKKLKSSGYVDAFDVIKIPEGTNQRVTQSYFPAEGAPSYSQLDAVFASKSAAKKIVEAHVVEDLGPDGKALPLPASFAERETRASDHRAVSVTIDLGR